MGDEAVVHVDNKGVWTYRASGLYNCTSVLVAARLGMQGEPVTGFMAERFAEGHLFEPIILERARRRGLDLYGFQDECAMRVGRAQVKGHIDSLGSNIHQTPFESIQGEVAGGLYPLGTVAFGPGLFGRPSVGLGRIAVVDAKAFAQSTWDKWCSAVSKGTVWTEFPYYAWQMSFYASMYDNAAIVMAIGLKDRDSLPELNLLDFRLDYFEDIPIPRTKIIQRVMEVERLAARGIDGLPEVCDQNKFPCPYYNMPFHRQPSEGAPVELQDKDIVGGPGRLAMLAEQRMEHWQTMKDAETAMAEMDELIKEAVGNQPVNKKVPSDFVSSVTTYHSSYQRVNWGQIIKDYPGFDQDKYKESVPSSKLSVRVNGKRSKGE